jgi:oligopeptide/dipeptide ABC transporter ATP-binding protein
VAIEGTVASPLDRPSGCSFRDRCTHARARCADAVPPLEALAPGHSARCFYPVDAKAEVA